MLHRSVAILAVIFGVVTVLAGGRVLAGVDPGYVVFRPLLLFNAAMGVVYVWAGLRAWRDPRRGRAWARAIALLNLLVLCAVAVAYVAGAGVAVQSLAAMSFRTLVWGGFFLALSSASRATETSDAQALEHAEPDEPWVIRPVADMPVTISSYYGVDHDEIDGLFEQFRAAKTGDRGTVLAAYREFKTRLERHIGWEEDILFPLFERLTGLTDNGPTAVMRGEHGQIKGFLAAIDATLDHGEMNTDADESALLDVLAAHNLKEEHVLYPMIDRQVSAADRESVFARMRAEADGR